MFPFFRIDVDRVGVAHDEQRTLGTVAAQSGHEVGPIGISGENFVFYARGIEDAFKVLNGQALTTWRVGGIEPD